MQNRALSRTLREGVFLETNLILYIELANKIKAEPLQRLEIKRDFTEILKMKKRTSSKGLNNI